MTLSEILTEQLKGKKLKTKRVEAYNSITCQTHYPNDELVLIDRVDLSDMTTHKIYGRIIGGDNDSQECNMFINSNTEFDLID